MKLINPNYGNSQTERDLKYGSLPDPSIRRFVMDQLTENNEVIGKFPETVALSMRDQLINNLTFNLPEGFSTVYEENPGEDSHYKIRNRF